MTSETLVPDNSAISSPPAKRAKTAATMEAPPALQIKKLSEKGRLPTRGSEFAAGYDIYAAKDTTIRRCNVSVASDKRNRIVDYSMRLQPLQLTLVWSVQTLSSRGLIKYCSAHLPERNNRPRSLTSGGRAILCTGLVFAARQL